MEDIDILSIDVLFDEDTYNSESLITPLVMFFHDCSQSDKIKVIWEKS